MAPPLNAALVSLWLREGRFDSLVAGVRAEAVARQRMRGFNQARGVHALAPSPEPLAV